MKTVAEIKRELRQIEREELCYECHAPLTEEEKEQGYVCSDCIRGWVDEAMNIMEA